MPIRFRTLLDEGTPLVVNLSKGQLGTDISNVMGGLIVSMLAQAAYTRSNTTEAHRRPYFLYVDEFHSFTTEAFSGMFSELRKYKLGLILSHQNCSQIDSKVHEAILGNVGNQIVFRVGAKDAPLLVKQLGRRANVSKYLDITDLCELPNYQNYICLMTNGKKGKVFHLLQLKPLLKYEVIT